MRELEKVWLDSLPIRTKIEMKDTKNYVKRKEVSKD